MTNLNDFKAGDKVRCLGKSHVNLTAGKEYEVLSTVKKFVRIIDDEGEECIYNMRLFEPVSETVVQDSDEPKQAEEIFKDGDKAYCPYVSGQIFTVCRDDRYNKDGLIIVDKFNKEIARIVKGVTRFSKISIIFHATEENRQALQVLHPHIEFEKPPVVLTGSDLCRAMLERGDKFVLCYTSDVGEEEAEECRYQGLITRFERDAFIANDYWKYAVPFDPRTGLPLTAEQAGV